MKNIIVISTSLRKNGNSERLADAFVKGAKEAGHMVEKCSLQDCAMHFCTGCMTCQHSRQGQCAMPDDADILIQKMAAADVIVFATPVYFYEMCGQMKTLLDRTNPLFPIPYKFKDIYLLTTAADSEQHAMDGVIKGLQGWIDCFEKSSLKAVVYGTSIDGMDAVLEHPEILNEAYELGKKA